MSTWETEKERGARAFKMGHKKSDCITQRVLYYITAT